MGIQYSFLTSQINRKRPLEEASSSSDLVDGRLSTPVKKKLKTSDYIYQQLFVQGEKFDVTILALGKVWNLHKVYLCQSPYFNSMFNSNWKESSEARISVSIPDKTVTVKSLELALGSLYRDDVLIEPVSVVPLLAAARLLQLDDLIEQCAVVMKENLSSKTAVAYLKAAETYGLVSLVEDCLQWLELNLLMLSGCSQLLKSLSFEIMCRLIASPNLAVVQGEMDVYSLLKKWLFLQRNPKCKKFGLSLKQAADEYFVQWRKANRTCSFLETTEGLSYLKVFEKLRLLHILTSSKCVSGIEEDNIIPKASILNAQAALWRLLLHVENSEQSGNIVEPISEEEFANYSVRCGRLLAQHTTFCWRWSGFNFGVDVLLNYKHQMVTLKRNCASQTCPYSVNLKDDRTIYYRLRVANMTEDRHITWIQDTGMKKVVLKKDETALLMRIPSTVSFPLTVIFNYMVTPAIIPPNAPMLMNAGGESIASTSLAEAGKSYSGKSGDPWGCFAEVDLDDNEFD